MKLEIPDSLEIDYTTPLNQDEFDKVVLSRRSVRSYTSDAVPEATVRHCLELALLSPSSSNLQPWEFHWVRSPDLKAKLASYCYSQPSARTASDLIVCVARTNTWSSNLNAIVGDLKSTPGVSPSAIKYHEVDLPKMLEQGFFGLKGYWRSLKYRFKGLKKVQARRPGGPGDLLLWAVKSTTLGIQTFMLAIRAHGFDSCPMEGFDEVRVGRLLNLPSDAHIVMVVSIGKRAKNGVYGKRTRLSKDQFIKRY
jgi:nitroreductase